MKKLLTLILLILSMNAISQTYKEKFKGVDSAFKSTYLNNYQMQTQWAREANNADLSTLAYFCGNQNEGQIIVKVNNFHNVFKDTLVQPYIFIQTSIDMFSVYIDGVNKRGFFMGKIRHHELAKIATLKYAEYIIIWVKNGKKQPVKKIMIVDKHIREQLTELITYTKPL